MSRTIHHRNQKNKHNGHDLWGKGPTCGWNYCSYSKKLGRQLTRKNFKIEHE